MTTGSSHRDEVRAGQRFEFGRNWRKFLWAIDEERIREAERSLAEMLEPTILRGVRFLDVGSGSGLFSLAARRLGAKVHSFDYDPESVDCTRELKNRYCPGDDEWIIEAGSVLDKQYLESIGKFELVYAWGVLHHTGSMWAALENVLARVAENGRLFTAIYNNQGWKSVIWRGVKKTWCSGCLGRAAVGSVFIPLFALAEVSKNLLSGRNPLRLCGRKARGMSKVHDWIDWLGGYPFEVATPEEVTAFCRDRGFSLEKLVSAGKRLGNNQYVFMRSGATRA
jgi:2-polyprenyl-6-hydroxyphenyl methylase/3-demethylubiquinone-9 3-methyltransferase